MTHKDVIILKTTTCAGCQKKMHHGHRAIALYNARGRLKHYTCRDACAKTILAHHSAAEALTTSK